MSRPASSKGNNKTAVAATTAATKSPIKDPRKTLVAHYNLNDNLPPEIGEKIFSKQPSIISDINEVDEEMEKKVLQKLISDESVPTELKEKISKAVLSGNLEVITENEREFLNNYHNNDNLNNQSIQKIDNMQQRERIAYATKAKKEADRARETFLYLKRHKLEKVPFLAIDSNNIEIQPMSGKDLREQKVRMMRDKEVYPVNATIDPRLLHSSEFTNSNNLNYVELMNQVNPINANSTELLNSSQLIESTSSISFTNMIMDDNVSNLHRNIHNTTNILSKSKVNDYPMKNNQALSRVQYAEMLKAERKKKLAKNKEKARQEKEQGEHQRMIERLTIEKKVELQKQLNSIRQKIREHLEAKKDPMRGEILRSLDESAILYLQQQYGNIGLTLSPEALLALIANHININYLTPESILELSQHDIYVSGDANMNQLLMNDSSCTSNELPENNNGVFMHTQVSSHMNDHSNKSLLQKSIEKFTRQSELQQQANESPKKPIENINSVYSRFNNYPRRNRLSSPHSLTAELSFNSMINNYNAFGQRFPSPQPGFAGVGKKEHPPADELLRKYEQGMKTSSRMNDNNPFVAPNPATSNHYVALHQNPFFTSQNTRKNMTSSSSSSNNNVETGGKSISHVKATFSASAPMVTYSHLSTHQESNHHTDDENRPFTTSYEPPLTLHEQRRKKKIQALGGGFRDIRIIQEQTNGGDVIRGRSPPASRAGSPTIVNPLGMMVLSSETLHQVAKEMGYTPEGEEQLTMKEKQHSPKRKKKTSKLSMYYTDEDEEHSDEENEEDVKKMKDEERLAAEAIYSMHQQLQREGLLSSQKTTEQVLSPKQLYDLGSKKSTWEDIFHQVRHQHPNNLQRSHSMSSQSLQYNPATNSYYAKPLDQHQEDDQISQLSRHSSSASITSNMNIQHINITTPQPSSLVPNTSTAAAKALTPSHRNNSNSAAASTQPDDGQQSVANESIDTTEKKVATENKDETDNKEQGSVPNGKEVVQQPLFFGSLALNSTEKQKLQEMSKKEQKKAAKRLILPSLQVTEKQHTDEFFTLEHLLANAPEDIDHLDKNKIYVLDNDSVGLTKVTTFSSELKSFAAQQQEHQEQLHRALLRSRGKESIVEDAEQRAVAIIESNKPPRSMKSQRYTSHIQRQTSINMQYPRDLQSIPAISPYPSYQESSNVMNYGIPSHAGLRLYLKRPKEEVTIDGRYRLSHAASRKTNKSSQANKPRPFISVT